VRNNDEYSRSRNWSFYLSFDGNLYIASGLEEERERFL
jgi:hypothetical protein